MSEVVDIPIPITEGARQIMVNRKSRREMANYFLVLKIPVHDSAGDLMDLCALKAMSGRGNKLKETGETTVETESEALGRNEGYSLSLTLLEPATQKLRIQAFSRRPLDKVGSITVSTLDGVPMVVGLEEHELGRKVGAWDKLLSDAAATVATELGWKKD